MAFVKGKSGNPAGRVKDKPWRDALMLAVNGKTGDQKNLRLIAERCVAAAVEGDMQAVKEIADRLDGKPIQGIEAQVSGDMTVNIVRFGDKP